MKDMPLEEVDRVPPPEVAEVAEKGLRLRRHFGRGGTAVALARARDLKNRRRISPQTIERINAYFARHDVDRNAENFGNDDNPSPGYVAWLLWGGDPGRDWARRVHDALERAAAQER